MRQEIADYLGLTIETVSRLLTKLKRRKIMSIARLDEIHINDVCRLCRAHRHALDPGSVVQLAHAGTEPGVLVLSSVRWVPVP